MRLGSFEGSRVGRRVFFNELRRSIRVFKLVGIRLMPARFDVGKLLLALKILVLWLKG